MPAVRKFTKHKKLDALKTYVTGVLRIAKGIDKLHELGKRETPNG